MGTLDPSSPRRAYGRITNIPSPFPNHPQNKNNQVQLAALLGDYKSATAALSDCGGAVEGARDSLEGSKHSAQGAARALERVEGVVRSMARARDGARWVRAPVS